MLRRLIHLLMALTISAFAIALVGRIVLTNRTIGHVATIVTLATLPIWLFLAATLRARQSTIGRR